MRWNKDKFIDKITLGGNMGIAFLYVFLFYGLLILIGGPLAIYGIYKIGYFLQWW